MKCMSESEDCSDKIAVRDMFSAQVRVPLCAKHFIDHLTLIALTQGGIGIDEALHMTPQKKTNALEELNQYNDIKIILIQASQGSEEDLESKIFDLFR